MNSRKENGLSAEKEPSTKEIDAYLERAGKESFPAELGILADERFEHGFDEKGEKEGWKGLKLRVIMQGVVASKIADFLKFSKEEKRAFVKASLLNMPMRRAQYMREDTKDVSKVTVAKREALDNEGTDILLQKGVNPLIVTIARAGNPGFSRDAGGGWINPKTKAEKQIYKAQKILLFVHDTVNPVKVANESGEKVWGIEFGDWRERLTGSAVESYKTINAESFPVKGEKEPKGYFALEMNIVSEAEEDILAGLKKNKIPVGKHPLWQFLKNEVYADVRDVRLPEVS